MLDDLKQRVWQANLDLVGQGLVVDTFGNASGVDRSQGLMVIKPSGVAYAELEPRLMVVVDLEKGGVIEGQLRPSSDTATHLEIYRAFPWVGGVVHTHSLHATAWAQAGREIPVLGTTHADYFDGPVPCTRPLHPEEIRAEYEANTGRVIVECLRNRGAAARECPAVLVAQHGPFAWGADPAEAARNALILEFLARLSSETLRLAPDVPPIGPELHRKHFGRKHGPTAYYGQPSKAAREAIPPQNLHLIR